MGENRSNDIEGSEVKREEMADIVNNINLILVQKKLNFAAGENQESKTPDFTSIVGGIGGQSRQYSDDNPCGVNSQKSGLITFGKDIVPLSNVGVSDPGVHHPHTITEERVSSGTRKVDMCVDNDKTPLSSNLSKSYLRTDRPVMNDFPQALSDANFMRKNRSSSRRNQGPPSHIHDMIQPEQVQEFDLPHLDQFDSNVDRVVSSSMKKVNTQYIQPEDLHCIKNIYPVPLIESTDMNATPSKPSSTIDHSISSHNTINMLFNHTDTSEEREDSQKSEERRELDNHRSSYTSISPSMVVDIHAHDDEREKRGGSDDSKRTMNYLFDSSSYMSHKYDDHCGVQCDDRFISSGLLVSIKGEGEECRVSRVLTDSDREMGNSEYPSGNNVINYSSMNRQSSIVGNDSDLHMCIDRREGYKGDRYNVGERISEEQGDDSSEKNNDDDVRDISTNHIVNHIVEPTVTQSPVYEIKIHVTRSQVKYPSSISKGLDATILDNSSNKKIEEF